MTDTLELAARPVAVYVIGGPGSGKSTALHGALRQLEWQTLDDELRLSVGGLLRGHTMIGPDGQSNGRYLGLKRAEFPGTDALSFSVLPQAVEWAAALRGSQLSLIVGEGARLTTADFLSALSRACRLVLVHCVSPDPDELAARRPLQNLAWQRGRVTAAANAFELAKGAWQTMPYVGQFVRTAEVDSSVSAPGEIADTIAGLALGLLTTQRSARQALERTR